MGCEEMRLNLRLHSPYWLSIRPCFHFPIRSDSRFVFKYLIHFRKQNTQISELIDIMHQCMLHPLICEFNTLGKLHFFNLPVHYMKSIPETCPEFYTLFEWVEKVSHYNRGFLISGADNRSFKTFKFFR